MQKQLKSMIFDEKSMEKTMIFNENKIEEASLRSASAILLLHRSSFILNPVSHPSLFSNH